MPSPVLAISEGAEIKQIHWTGILGRTFDFGICLNGVESNGPGLDMNRWHTSAR